jgi:hypothetical protein
MTFSLELNTPFGLLSFEEVAAPEEAVEYFGVRGLSRIHCFTWVQVYARIEKVGRCFQH